MGVPPDFEVKDRERYGLVVSYPEDADVWQLPKPAADKNRLGERRVVVSRKDHDREMGLGEQTLGAIEDGRTELIALEGVAGQKKDVGTQRLCGRQHRAKGRRTIATFGRSAILIDMQIRAVDKYDIGG